MSIVESVHGHAATESQHSSLENFVYVSTAKQKPPLTVEELENMEKPKVLISGAGIGGLTLAILLKKANIPFLVLEKTHDAKPLGTFKHLTDIIISV